MIGSLMLKSFWMRSSGQCAIGYLSGTAGPAPAGTTAATGSGTSHVLIPSRCPRAWYRGHGPRQPFAFGIPCLEDPPSPVLDVDLVDDHERRVQGLVQDVEKKLAYALDQLCLLFACHARVPRKRPLPRDLNVDDRHCTSPAGLSLIV